METTHAQQNSEKVPTAFDANSYLVWMHLSQFLGLVIPWGSLIAPVGFWLYKRQESPVVDRTGKEIINFQISMMIYMIISGVLVLLLVGVFMLLGLLIFQLVVIIKAAIKTGDGEVYSYPLTIRFFK